MSIVALTVEGLRNLGSIIKLAVKLLLRHWPQLLALYLAGSAARLGFLWLALIASKYSPLLGVLILALAPISALMSVVFMIRVIGQSLPAFSNSFAGQRPGQRLKSNVTLAARAIIPFLVVYAAMGFLHDDVRFFIYGSTLDEAINDPLAANFGRAVVNMGLLTGIAVVALIARKLISAAGLADKSLRWALISGYIETLWIATLGTVFVAQLASLREWAMTRVIVAQWFGGSNPAAETSTGTPIFSDALSTIGGQLGELVFMLVVPLSWLAIAAIIYGNKLNAQNRLSHEAMTEHFRQIPGTMRRSIAQLTEPVTTPLKDIWNAIDKIADAGLVTMIFFCVFFTLTGLLIGFGVNALAHQLIGPQSGLAQLAIEPYVALVARGFLLLIFTALTAAAVNYVLSNNRDGRAAGPAV